MDVARQLEAAPEHQPVTSALSHGAVRRRERRELGEDARGRSQALRGIIQSELPPPGLLPSLRDEIPLEEVPGGHARLALFPRAFTERVWRVGSGVRAPRKGLPGFPREAHPHSGSRMIQRDCLLRSFIWRDRGYRVPSEPGGDARSQQETGVFPAAANPGLGPDAHVSGLGSGTVTSMA